MRALTSVRDLDLPVNARGQRWTHTHARTALSVFFCCKSFTPKIEFQWGCVIVGFVFPRRQWQHMCMQVLKLMLLPAATHYLIQSSSASHLNSGLILHYTAWLALASVFIFWLHGGRMCSYETMTGWVKVFVSAVQLYTRLVGSASLPKEGYYRVLFDSSTPINVYWSMFNCMNLQAACQRTAPKKFECMYL